MQYSQKPNNYRFFANFSLHNGFFLKITKFGTFKCIILHLFCNTLFFVSWSWKFDFGFWLNLPVQICNIWNISIIGFEPVWGFQWTNLQVQGAIFSVITRTKKIWKKKIYIYFKKLAPIWRQSGENAKKVIFLMYWPDFDGSLCQNEKKISSKTKFNILS